MLIVHIKLLVIHMTHTQWRPMSDRLNSIDEGRQNIWEFLKQVVCLPAMIVVKEKTKPEVFPSSRTHCCYFLVHLRDTWHRPTAHSVSGFVQLVTRCLQFYFMVAGTENFIFFNLNICSILFVSWLLSVQFSHSVVSNSLRPHGPQHASPPCPSPTPGVYPNSCPLSQWCHPAISSSVVPFSSCHQSFPASGSFQMSQFFTLGSQSIGGSALASVLPMNVQD